MTHATGPVFARRAIFLPVFIFVVLSVAVPCLNLFGSLTYIDGSAGIIDHLDKWMSFDFVTGFTYLIGDIVCHQSMERSLFLNGSQIPICARDFSILLGLLAGLAACESSAVRARFAKRNTVILGFLLVMTAFAEWCAEQIGVLDSMEMRMITGAAAGIGLAILIFAYLERGEKG